MAIRREIKIKSGTRKEAHPLSSLFSVGKNTSSNIDIEDVLKKITGAEEFLRKQERLAILGEVAAEIAHEIRNPLTVIKMLVQSIQDKIQAEPFHTMKDDVALIAEKIRHMERIIDQVLTMGRPGEVSLSPTDIRVFLEETLSFLRFRLAQQRIQLVQHFEDTIPVIHLDRGLMSQVFLNIILNAIQAMPKGGVLTVSLKMSLDKLLIQFEDTGVGIPEEHLDKLFQPFFTSKAGGTGLGLAVVQRIVESHSGGIYVQSEVGKGSNFTIELPILG